MSTRVFLAALAVVVAVIAFQFRALGQITSGVSESQQNGGFVLQGSSINSSQQNGGFVLQGTSLNASEQNGGFVLGSQFIFVSQQNGGFVLCDTPGVGACPAVTGANLGGLLLRGIGN